MAIDKTLIKEHYNKLALKRDSWIKRNEFYHSEIVRYYKFQVQENSSVLELGCGTGDLLNALNPSRGVGVDISEESVRIAKERFPNLDFICADAEEFSTNEKFDYIIISGTLGQIEDIQCFLKKISAFATHDTRIIIDYYNHLWESVLVMTERWGMKMPETIHNWLSLDDIGNFLQISGYEVIKNDFFMLVPKYIPILTPLFNKIISKLPILRRLCLMQFVVARLDVGPDNIENLTASVVLTCRDERDNIEPIVKRIPKIGNHTEIIFVEGHSKDGTRQEINKMIEKYPDKDIKLLVQDGIGQGDAFRKGFDNAKGDFILWLEADLTTPPEELSKLWDAYISGSCEYANGTRLIYKMEETAMPVLNFIGNRFFGNLFSWLLDQRFTDSLCGLKGISKRNYRRIRKEINYFGDFDPFGDFELIFGVIKNNLKVADIPVKYYPRQYGKTKTKLFKHGFLLLKMSWIAFKKFKMF